jgi:phosphoglycolate phosphatase
MIKNTILFDFDFTLADSSQGIFKCINYALNKMNLPEQDYNTIKYTIGHSLPETYRILTKRNSEREENEFVKLFVKKADEIMNLNTLVYPEVFELMPMIKEKGYKTGIISTKYRYRIQG